MKNSFVIYNDIYEVIKELTDEEAGILFKAILCYQSTGEIIEMPRDLRLLFLTLKSTFDRDNDKYEKTVQKRREAGKKGGESKCKQMQANANTCKQVQANQADSDSDSDSVTVKEKESKEKENANALFEYLWSLYPNKKGKAQVKDKTKKRLLEIGADEMERAIERYTSELAKDDWRKPQNGSTFFNSGYVDYLDANFVPTEIRKSTGNKFLDLLMEDTT